MFASGTNQLVIVAHPDDDTLFMNPTIDNAIQSGARLRTVYLTAAGNNQNTLYSNKREEGAKDAYAYMAGVLNSWLTSTMTINRHVLSVATLAGNSNICLIFMRLHEYADVGHVTLTSLWNNEADGPITSLDGTDSYTRSDLIQTLADVIQQDNPAVLNILDTTAVFETDISMEQSNILDHPDHIAGGLFAQQAWERAGTSTILNQFRGDNISSAPPTLSSTEASRKQNIFLNHYAPYDPLISSNYDPGWFSRLYPAHDYPHTVMGDFIGTGKTDILAFYREGDIAHTTARYFAGTDNDVLSTPQIAWDSGSGNWDWNRSVFLAGDFNGNGTTDVICLYDVPSEFGHTQAWLFNGSPQGIQPPVLVWDSGVGNWDWGRANYVVGDFTGDGKADIVAFYQYNEFGHTKAWLFAGTSTGIAAPVVVWDSGIGQWDWTHAKYVVGGANCSDKATVFAFYRYNEPYHIKIFTCVDATTGLFSPIIAWDSGVDQWDWSCS